MNLTGQMLVAMPGMGDPRFEQTVIYLCAHSDEGAMGLTVNKPATDLTLGEVLDKLDIDLTGPASGLTVHVGGPVEMGRGFVLHTDDYESKLETLALPGGLGMTATQDILEDIAAGDGPEKALFMLGYSGWGPGQLEAEIAQNGWLTCDGTRELIFDTIDDDKWLAALKSLGIDPLGLSSTAGRA